MIFARQVLVSSIGLLFCLLAFLIPIGYSQNAFAQKASESDSNSRLKSIEASSIPDEIGLAGPVVGVHDHHLIVAGGAHFAKPDAADL